MEAVMAGEVWDEIYSRLTELIEAQFDQAPALLKKPGCPTKSL